MVSRTRRCLAVLALCGVLVALWVFSIPNAHAGRSERVATDMAVVENARLMLDEGRRVFRFETFGDEAFWGDTLKLHQAIAGSKLGGVGPGVSPKTPLSVGLKVDVDAVPAAVAAALKAGKVDLDDPASTWVLLLNVGAIVCLAPDLSAYTRLLGVGEPTVKKVLASTVTARRRSEDSCRTPKAASITTAASPTCPRS